jgi:thiamine monophosphate kinase
VCRRLDAQLVGPQVGGELSVTVAVAGVLGSGADAVDCAAPPGCVLATTEYAGRLATVPLQFLGPPVTTTTSTTSTTSTTAPPATTSTSTTSTSTTSTTTEDPGS